MTRQTKIIIGILVIIGVLFIAITGLGTMNSGRDMNRQEQEAYAEAGNFPPWLENLGSLMAPVAPKVALNVRPYMPMDGGETIELAIAPSNQSFRVITFDLDTGILDITYQDATEQAQSLDLDEQPLTLPREADRASQRRSGSVLVFENGGRLTLHCWEASAEPCWVTTTQTSRD